MLHVRSPDFNSLCAVPTSDMPLFVLKYIWKYRTPRLMGLPTRPGNLQVTDTYDFEGGRGISINPLFKMLFSAYLYSQQMSLSLRCSC